MTELSAEAKHLGLDEEIQDPEPMQVVQEEPEPAAEERPEWLSEKYTSVEEQARAYSEAQAAMHEANQRAKALEERLTALERQQPQQQQDQYNPYDYQYDPLQQVSYEDQLRELYDQDPVAATRALLAERDQQLYQMQQQAQQIQNWQQQQQKPIQDTWQETQAQLIADSAVERVTSRHEDFQEYAEDVKKWLNEENPGYISDTDAWNLAKMENALETAYKVKKAERILAHEDELRSQGLSPEEIERQRKVSSQTLTGASARPQDPSEDEKQLAAMVASGDQSYAAARRQIWGDLRSPQT